MIKYIKNAGAVFYMVLFCPCFLFWADNLTINEILFRVGLVSILAAIALSYLVSFTSGKTYKTILTVLFILSIPANIITWSYLYTAKQWMTVSSLWVIFSTNTKEATEYISQFTDITNIFVAVLYVIVGIILIAFAKNEKRISFKKLVDKIMFPVAFITVTLVMISHYLTMAVPTFSLYHSVIRFAAYNNDMRNMLHLSENMPSASCNLQDGTSHVFVIVIGESTNIYHQNIYGYSRETTPMQSLLKKNGELIVYKDVVTPHVSTRNSLEKVLSFANHDFPKKMITEPSIVDIVNSAGFTSYWVNNQEISGMWQSPVCYVCANHSYFLIDLINENNDAAVIEPFYKILSDSSRNKIIFLHLVGNHFAYSNRYPSTFNKFDHKNQLLEDKNFRTEYMKQTIDEYDNSILFGDYLLNEIIDTLRKIDVSSFVLFFSDHGEDVYDDRDFLGHQSVVFPTQYQARVPFVLWRSSLYLKEVPEIIIDTIRPYNTEDLIHSVATLMRISYPSVDSTRSIFSPYFTKRQRFVEKTKWK
ncbi:MAG: sulfatase-like hydrolase/transferase [Bacteroidales bacterium]|nr:sulfatase-like hydrolase/transferase [Bacteroidales bacterium]